MKIFTSPETKNSFYFAEMVRWLAFSKFSFFRLAIKLRVADHGAFNRRIGRRTLDIIKHSFEPSNASPRLRYNAELSIC